MKIKINIRRYYELLGSDQCLVSFESEEEVLKFFNSMPYQIKPHRFNGESEDVYNYGKAWSNWISNFDYYPMDKFTIHFLVIKGKLFFKGWCWDSFYKDPENLSTFSIPIDIKMFNAKDLV